MRIAPAVVEPQGQLPGLFGEARLPALLSAGPDLTVAGSGSVNQLLLSGGYACLFSHLLPPTSLNL